MKNRTPDGEFIQQKRTFIIGIRENPDITQESLEFKDSAKLLVVSDSHGKKDRLKHAILEEGKNSDMLLFCGDGIEDLFSILEESVYDKELFSALPKGIAFAQGNGDYNTAYAVLSKSGPQTAYIIPPQITFRIANKNIFLTHGHLFDVYFETTTIEHAAANSNKADIIFYGHTHRRDFHENKGVHLINPGSIGHPRDGLPPCYAVVRISGDDVDCTFVESLDYL